MTDLFTEVNSSHAELSLTFSFIISSQTILVFIWLVYGICCQLIVVFGIITNIINIICFVQLGFKESINVSLLGLSVSDLGCLATLSVTNVCFTMGFTVTDLTFDPIEVNYLTTAMPHLTFSRVTNWITALITLERCLCVSAPLKIKRIVTTKRASIIIVSVFVALWLSSIPVYFVNKLDMKFLPLRNKTVLGLIFTEDREQVEKYTFMINSFFLPFVAFIIILICTATLVMKLNSTAKWRENSLYQSTTQGLSNRNKKVAKMVVMISTLFIVCFIPMSISMLALAFEPELSFGGRYVNVGIILGGVGFILESVNSSANIFIYNHMSTKYKDVFLMLFCRKGITA